MTGNNKWRRPLAVLASVATLATMGMVAGTATADDRQPHTVTFKLDTQTLTVSVPDGASVADAVHGWSLSASDKAEVKSGISYDANFTGWGNYDFLAPVTSNVTVTGTETNPASNSAATVVFTDATTNAWLTFPDGAGTKSFNRGGVNYTGDYYTVPAQGTLGKRVPVDTTADGKLVTKWNVDQVSENGVVQHVAKGISDLSTVDTSTSAGDLFVVTPADKTTSANTLIVDGSTTDGYPIGSYADGAQDEKYTVDVVKGQKVKLPGSWVNASGAGYTSPNSLKDGDTSYAFGSEYKVPGDVTLTPSAETTTSYWVTFLKADGSQLRTYRATDDSQDDLEGAFLSKTDREDIANIKIDNFVVKGWAITPSSDYTKVKLDGKSVTAGHLFSADDFDALSFSANVTFTPVQGGTTGTVKVTFRDTNYVGKNDSVVVDAQGGEFLSADKFPTFTRKGYVFSKWVLSDGNGNPVSPEQKFTTNSLIGAGVWKNNFTVVAVWEKVDASVLDAALHYVPVDAAHELLFTDGSWSAFKDVYQSVVNEKQQLEYVSSNEKVSDDDAARLVTKLSDAWQKLVFATNKDNHPVTSYRFYNKVTNEHLFTSDPKEIASLKANGDWNYEGTAFEAFKTGNVFKELASFKKAAGDAKVNDAVKDKLASIAKPIVTGVYRLYNPITNEHLFTTDSNEYNVLAAGDWSAENVQFYAPLYGTTKDVYRLYNPVLNQHLFTLDKNEVQYQTTKGGWNNEGSAFKAL